MKRSLCLLVAVHLCLMVSVWGQSLGELARKERERREKIKDKTEVVTGESLREAPGSTLSTLGEGSTTPARGLERSSPPEKQAGRAERDEAAEGLSEWRQSFTRRVSEVSSKVKEAQQEVVTCADRDNRYVVDVGGTLVDVSRERCAAAREKLRESQETLKQIQSQCMNEARKMDLLPGQARQVCYSGR